MLMMLGYVSSFTDAQAARIDCPDNENVSQLMLMMLMLGVVMSGWLVLFHPHAASIDCPQDEHASQLMLMMLMSGVIML